MNNISKGDVWVGSDGWRVLVTKVTNKYVTFFAGYDTITEEIEMFINGYTKENNMILDLREIEIGENWFNKNSENMVVVDDVYLEKGVVQVEYSYLEGDEEYPCRVADLDYFMKEYIRMPYSVNEGRDYEKRI